MLCALNVRGLELGGEFAIALAREGGELSFDHRRPGERQR